MPSLTKLLKNHSFLISDDGDSFQLALFDDMGIQVAGAFFPDDGSGQAFELAHTIGRFYGKPINEIDRSQKP
jgi:hypothetical protein